MKRNIFNHNLIMKLFECEIINQWYDEIKNKYIFIHDFEINNILISVLNYLLLQFYLLF